MIEQDKNKIASLRSGTTNEDGVDMRAAAARVVRDCLNGLPPAYAQTGLGALQLLEDTLRDQDEMLAKRGIPADWAAHEARLEAACRTALIQFGKEGNEELAAIMRWGLTGDDRPPPVLDLTEDMKLPTDADIDRHRRLKADCGGHGAFMLFGYTLGGMTMLSLLIAAVWPC